MKKNIYKKCAAAFFGIFILLSGLGSQASELKPNEAVHSQDRKQHHLTEIKEKADGKSDQGKPLLFAADPWCPYNCEPESEHPGFMIEIARQAFKQAGYSIQYKILNWARAKRALNEGEIDGLVGMARSPDNLDKWVFPDESLGIEQMCFYTALPQWQFHDLTDLETVQLGVINGYGYGPELDRYLKDVKQARHITAISGNNLLSRLTRMMLLKRIDVMIDNRVVMDHQLSKSTQRVEDVHIAGCVADPREVHIVFSIHNPLSRYYAKILSDGVKRMRESGELKSILSLYGVHDWGVDG